MGRDHHRFTPLGSGPITAAVLSLFLAASLLAGTGEPWTEKPLDQFTEDDLLQLLTNSPWSRRIEVWQSTGRVLAELANGEIAVHQEARNSPPLEYSVRTVSTYPERMHSVYTVRWSSAPILINGHERLTASARYLADLHSVPSEAPDGEIVITVRVAEPPRPSGSDQLSRAQIFKDSQPISEIESEPPTLFSGRKDDEILAAAELRTNLRIKLSPLRIEHHGLGAGEAFSFIFARTTDNGPVVASDTKWVEVRLKDELGTSLKARFRLREMQINGTPNF